MQMPPATATPTAGPDAGRNPRTGDGPLSALPDETLLVLFAKGDREAAHLLTGRLTPVAFRVALRMLGGDRAEAEDVAQEAMLRLWRQAPEWRQDGARVSTWLYRVATNLATDRLRCRRGQPLDGVDAPDEMQVTAVARLIETDRAAALDAALAALPERQRQAVVLRHIEGLTNPEIAEVMGIGVEAVESLTARGKRMLASLLAGRREELGYAE